MNELISINSSTIGGQSVNTVNARDLHLFLESKKDFSSWIKDRIEKYGFSEGIDFVTISRSPIQGSGNRGASIDYHLSIGMAKELSMVDRNEKGKQARLYFLECERRAQAATPAFQLPQTLPEALRLAADLAEQNGNLQKQIDITQPKAEALDRIALADGNHCITNSAKILQARPKDIFALMQAKRWIYRRVGGRGWVAYQDKIQQGLLTHKVTTVTDIHTGQELVAEQVQVTPKGLAKLSTMLGQMAAA